MAEKYELGQGYVQIIPSAKGIEGKISAMLDPEAEKAGESAGKKVGAGMGTGIASVGKKIGKEIGIAVAAVGTATGKLIKDALAEYGEYEQLTGGVAKLFGDNADAVLKNASNAFKNAQLSANEYMQTVTSFSASLISSLGGDTEKAVAYADTAINDMADNANTFGTSMESIQNAYQGFAKQNYTMLDNLKLGYGGTKTEMERLVKDAEGLNSAFKATRDENGELALSFSDIVDAIHIVQENMGITGTTAKEAASTVQGSINTLKASWKNFLTGLGDPNADVKALTQNVISSAKQVIKNVMPIIKNVLKEIPTALKEIWDSLGQGKSTIAALGVSFAGLKLGSTIWDLAKATGSFSPALGVAVGAVTAFGAAMAKVTYDMAMAKLESDELYQRQQFLTERTNELTGAVNANAEAYAQRSSARQEALNANMAEISNTQELWGELKNLLSTNDELSESEKARAQFILDQVNKALGTEYDLTDLLTEQKHELIDAIDKEMQARKDAVALQVLEEAYADALRNQAAAQQEFADISAQRSAVEAEASAVRMQQMAMEEEARNNLLISSDASWAQEKAVIDARVKAYDEQLAEIQTSYDTALKTIAQYNADKAMYEDASIAHAQGTLDIEKMMSAETRDAYIKDAQASAEGVAAANAEATQSVLDNLAAQLSALTGSEWQFKDAGDGSIMAYVDGFAAGTPLAVSDIKKMISDMQSAVSNSKSGFVTSTGYVMDGITETINAKKNSAVTAITNLASAMNNAYKRTNQIQSPSKLYAESTEWINKGIIKGLESGEDDVLASMRDLAVDMSDAYNSVIGDDATFSASKNINSITNETANFAGTITTAESASSKLDAIYAALSTFFPQMLEASEKDVVLDGGRLVGSLAPKINTELGKLQTKNNRGGICTA